MNSSNRLPPAVLALACLLSFAACDKPSSPHFLKTGKTYFLEFSRDWPSGGPTEFTIVESGGGEWFLVEYARPDKSLERRWINFATVLSVEERKKP